MKRLTLSDAIDRSGIEKQEVAKRMGVYPSQVTRWCKGECRVYADQATKLAAILNVSLTRIDWS